MFGYTVTDSSLGFYYGTDLIHRFYHISNNTVGVVDHHADSYTNCLALATEKPELAILNSHLLQYFVADCARTVALPPNGCLVEAKQDTAKPTTTSRANAPCQTHEDGEVRCPAGEDNDGDSDRSGSARQRRTAMHIQGSAVSALLFVALFFIASLSSMTGITRLSIAQTPHFRGGRD